MRATRILQNSSETPGRFGRALRASLMMLGVCVLFAALGPVAGASAGSKVHCNRIAAPYGSDWHGNGSHRRPFRTLVRLDLSLRPGQTGCLRAGSYGDFGTHHWISRSGTWRRPITVRGYPGEHVKLVGWIQITASHTRFSDFEIDGANTRSSSGSRGCANPVISAGLSIEGTGDVFERNDYYQSVASLRGNGLGVGWSGSGDFTVIRRNRIHDVGQCRAFDHLIYLAHGRNVRIYDNWLWDDPHGWGVQIYPGPIGAQIFANVVYAAGSGFVVGGTPTTSGNHIFHNVILDSTGLVDAGLRGAAISDSWDGTPGHSNVFAANDSYHNRDVAVVSAVHVSRNITSNPRLVDPAAHDFRLLAGSRLSRWGLWDGGLGRVSRNFRRRKR